MRPGILKWNLRSCRLTLLSNLKAKKCGTDKVAYRVFVYRGRFYQLKLRAIDKKCTDRLINVMTVFEISQENVCWEVCL